MRTASPSQRRPRQRRLVAATVGLLAAVLLALLLGLALGSRAIPFDTVLGAVLGDVGGPDATVVTSQRLPRTVLGLVAGAALGMAGALMQGHTRNPLADPGLFGVNAGASFGIAVTVFGLGATGSAALFGSALAGAAVVSVVVLVAGLGALRGSALVTLAVLGTTLGALLSALTGALILLDERTLDVLRFWEAGSLANPATENWPVGMPLIAVGMVLALANGPALRALSLGEEVAASLGNRVRTARIVGIVAITLLGGAATALCGPVAFVGLVAPHVVRRVAGHDYRWLVPLAGLAGAVLLVVADTLGRVVTEPGELEAGIMMAAVGAPVLIAVTRRRRLVAL